MYFYASLKNKNDISFKNELLRYVAAIVMCSCLLFLTGINFIVYSADTKTISIALDTSGDNTSDEIPSEKPVEEKSSTSSVSIQEEYVHEMHSLQNNAGADIALNYSLLDEAKLSIVHFELISPPPDL